jgi:hypothetical protein
MVKSVDIKLYSVMGLCALGTLLAKNLVCHNPTLLLRTPRASKRNPRKAGRVASYSQFEKKFEK